MWRAATVTVTFVSGISCVELLLGVRAVTIRKRAFHFVWSGLLFVLFFVCCVLTACLRYLRCAVLCYAVMVMVMVV